MRTGACRTSSLAQGTTAGLYAGMFPKLVSRDPPSWVHVAVFFILEGGGCETQCSATGWGALMSQRGNLRRCRRTSEVGGRGNGQPRPTPRPWRRAQAQKEAEVIIRTEEEKSHNNLQQLEEVPPVGRGGGGVAFISPPQTLKARLAQNAELEAERERKTKGGPAPRNTDSRKSWTEPADAGPEGELRGLGSLVLVGSPPPALHRLFFLAFPPPQTRVSDSRPERPRRHVTGDSSALVLRRVRQAAGEDPEEEGGGGGEGGQAPRGPRVPMGRAWRPRNPNAPLPGCCVEWRRESLRDVGKGGGDIDGRVGDAHPLRALTRSHFGSPSSSEDVE